VTASATGKVRALLTDMDPMLLLLRLSLLTLLVNSNEDPAVFIGLAVLAVVALPRPALLSSPWFWTVLFVGVGLRQIATWHDIDDHIVATTYWCGALALILRAKQQWVTTAAAARLLIGSMFALAAAWKLGSGQFSDGTFFRYSLLLDDRFSVVAQVVGRTSPSALDSNVDAVRQLATASSTGGGVELVEGGRNEAVAYAFTTWGIVIESAVAVAFLVPLRRSLAWLRHAALAGFVGTTYLIVPVGGFGMLLLVLGSTQTTSDQTRLRYLKAVLALLAWTVVWRLLLY